MRKNLYELAEELRLIISSAENKEKAVSDFFCKHDLDVKESDVLILQDGTPVIKHDEGFDYDKGKLLALKESVSKQLSLFSEEDLPNQNESRGDAKDQRERSGGDARKVRNVSRRQNPILRDGVSAYYSSEKGWNGKENHPWTIKGAWDKFGFVDFLGMEYRTPRDLAEMFSIYRNPYLEYFHIILAKDGKIVRQIGMTSGLSAMVRIVPEGGFEEINKIVKDIDFDAAYLVHNHPSGSIEPSKEDINGTGAYIFKVFGDRLKGHIILDHDKFTLITPHKIDEYNKESIRLIPEVLDYAPHKIPEAPKSLGRIKSPGDVAAHVKRSHTSGTCVIDLDNGNGIRDIRPFSIEDYDPINFMNEMKTSYIRNRILITDNVEDYDKIVMKFITAKIKHDPRYQPLLDCIYLDSSGNYNSLYDRNLLKPIDWQSYLAAENHQSFTWNEDTVNHPKQGYLFEQKQSYGSNGNVEQAETEEKTEFILSADEEKLFLPDSELKAKYEKRLESVFNRDSNNDRTEIAIGQAPFILRSIGYPDGRLILPVSVAAKAMGLNSIGRKASHNVPFEVMRVLPDHLYNPVAIINTGKRVKNGSEYECLLFAANLFSEGKPLTTAFILIPTEQNGKTIYRVSSIYGHDVISPNGNRYFEECLRNNQYLYGISKDLEFVQLPNEKENLLQSMNSRNNIGNASAARSVQQSTAPSQILLPDNVPTKIDVVKKYRQERQSRRAK